MKCKNCINLFDVVDEDDNPDGKWCPQICDSPDVEIDRQCDKFKPITNADRIRSMTDEELADYLIKLTEVVPTCEVCEPTYRETGDCDCQCETGVLRWLKMEIE